MTSYIGVVKIVLSPPPLPFSLVVSAQDQAFCIFEFAPLVSIPTLPVPDPVGRSLPSVMLSLHHFSARFSSLLCNGRSAIGFMMIKC